MRKVLSISLSLLLINGCAYTSGALKVGPDTYSISANASPARGGEAGAYHIALEEANKKCASEEKEILVINDDLKTNTSMMGFHRPLNSSSGLIGPISFIPITIGSSTITFRCLSSEEIKDKHLIYQSPKKSVIEIRDR